MILPAAKRAMRKTFHFAHNAFCQIVSGRFDLILLINVIQHEFTILIFDE